VGDATDVDDPVGCGLTGASAGAAGMHPASASSSAGEIAMTVSPRAHLDDMRTPVLALTRLTLLDRFVYPWFAAWLVANSRHAGAAGDHGIWNVTLAKNRHAPLIRSATARKGNQQGRCGE